MRLSDVPRFPLDSNKTPEQPDNNTAVAKAHASHFLLPRLFKPLPSQSFRHHNHCLWKKMTHYERKID